MLEYNLMIAGKIVLAPVKPEPISFQALELLRSNITEINNNFPNKNLTIEIVLNNVNFAYGHVADCIRGLVTTYGNWVNMSVIPTKADFERNYNVNPEESMGTVVEQFPNRAASVSILELSYSLLARYKILLSGIKESMIQENTASANSTLENIATVPQEAVL
jgi:cellulose biosynthesis protein BcsQ